MYAAASWFTGATTSSAQISTVLIYFLQRCLVLAWSWTNDHFGPSLVVIAIRGGGTSSSSAQVGSWIWTDMMSWHLIDIIKALCSRHAIRLSEDTTLSVDGNILSNGRSSLNQLSQAECCKKNAKLQLVRKISIYPTWSHLRFFLFANIRHLPPIWFRCNPQVEDRRDSWEPSRRKSFQRCFKRFDKDIGFVESVGFVGCCQDAKLTNTSHRHWVSSPAEAWPLQPAFDMSSACHSSSHSKMISGN